MENIVEIIMLPTEDDSIVHLRNDINTPSNQNFNKGKLEIFETPLIEQDKAFKYYQKQHLYLTCNDDIKEGDYAIDLRDKKIFRCENILSNHYESGVLSFQKSYCKKMNDSIVGHSIIEIYINSYNIKNENLKQIQN